MLLYRPPFRNLCSGLNVSVDTHWVISVSGLRYFSCHKVSVDLNYTGYIVKIRPERTVWYNPCWTTFSCVRLYLYYYFYYVCTSYLHRIQNIQISEVAGTWPISSIDPIYKTRRIFNIYGFHSSCFISISIIRCGVILLSV